MSWRIILPGVLDENKHDFHVRKMKKESRPTLMIALFIHEHKELKHGTRATKLYIPKKSLSSPFF